MDSGKTTHAARMEQKEGGAGIGGIGANVPEVENTPAAENDPTLEENKVLTEEEVKEADLANTPIEGEPGHENVIETVTDMPDEPADAPKSVDDLANQSVDPLASD